MVTISQARKLSERIFRDHPTKNFAIRFWDGSEIAWCRPPLFTLIFNDGETFQRLFSANDPALFAEAFIEQRFDIEGDPYDALALGRYLRTVKLGLIDKLASATALGFPQSRHTPVEDARDVQAHYDLSNNFYRLFLDARLVYSSAYFTAPDQSLEEAQEQKLDLVCRKLQLQRDEELLDVGCGWGAFLIWAAEHYGVRGHGITLSKNQQAWAAERIRAAGLTDRVQVELRHYSELPKKFYDKIASMGMYEHVGIARYPQYFGAVYHALKPGGLFLNDGITIKRNQPPRTGGEFIFRHVFPGAELPDISSVQAAMEDAGFEVLHVHSLRWDYAKTLRAWMQRFCAHEREAAQYVPERILRIWKLYLPGCALAFEEGLVSNYQVLLQKNAASTHAGSAATPST